MSATVPVDTACGRCGKRPKLRLYFEELASIRQRLPDLHPDTPVAVMECPSCGHPVTMLAAHLYLTDPRPPVVEGGLREKMPPAYRTA